MKKHSPEKFVRLSHLIGNQTGEALNELEINLWKITSALRQEMLANPSPTVEKWIDLAFEKLKYVSDSIRESQDVAREMLKEAK